MADTVNDRPLLTAARPALRRAVDYLSSSQLSDGEFPIYLSSDRSLASDLRIDSTCFATTFVLYALSSVSDPDVTVLKARAFRFLRAEQDEQGTCRYATRRNPARARLYPDLDDTACVSWILRQAGRRFTPNEHILRNNRTEEGLFKTWVRPAGLENDVDTVVNANVILYLGEDGDTSAARRHLHDAITAHREHETFWYYEDVAALYYMVSRAALHSAPSLRDLSPILIERVSERLDQAICGSNPLAVALGVCTLLNCGQRHEAGLRKALQALLDSQDQSGFWPRIPFYTGSLPGRRREFWFGSEALTTAFCVQALAQFQPV